MMMNGYSTGWPPIHVRTKRSATRIQYIVCVIGRKVNARCFEVWRSGIKARITIDRISASTPPSLFGIDRRMA